MKNNLFYYATSELSQDAFLCWLLSYAQKEAEEDDGLNSCAVNLVKKFIPNLICSDDIYVTEIVRQYKNIDILLTVNDKYVVIIENKINTSDHSNQLKRYEEAIKTDELYGKLELCKVFYKTGFHSNIVAIEKAGYLFVGLEQIVALLAPYKTQTENQIFHDYISYWENFNNSVMEYKTLPLNKWEGQQINGYFRDLKNSDVIENSGFDTDYDYVSNPRGGLFAMWFSNESFLYYNEQKYEVYLQLEFFNGRLQLCLKTGIKKEEGVDTDVTPSQLRNFLTYYIDESGKWEYALSKYNFIKPDRFGTGATMTIGVIPINVNSWNEISKYVIDVMRDFEEIKTSFDDRK